ncbi:hypothetical protein BX600DRAFT_303119 [Xylariales sp. PMI_506]|nr:hypothetical protein BX600DRAFT_303119 [Xylariales sp. PMI_506]
MSSPRLFAMKSAFRIASRPALPRPLTGPKLTRCYSSVGSAAKKSSDIPWLVAALGISVPGTVWILSNGPGKSQDHHAHEADGHDDAHDEGFADEKENENEEPEKGEEPAGDSARAAPTADTAAASAPQQNEKEDKVERQKGRKCRLEAAYG